MKESIPIKKLKQAVQGKKSRGKKKKKKTKGPNVEEMVAGL